jgi:type I restriction enzyme S subunit
MNDWQTCAVPDSFVKNKVGRQNQIPAKDIAEAGRFPVVDQGQKFVAGYCDDESRVIDFDLPLIVFGDHTRCFKFVDFPFVLGADGTKVLLPNKKLYDPRFYYFALLALEIPSRGYNRHFTILNERSLPLPPLPEQKKIAHILSTVQRAIEAQERIIQTTTELKTALMHKLFTEGLRGEPQKQTEIGPVPESWEVKRFDSFAVLQRGFDITKKDQRPGEYPVVSSGGISSCHDEPKVKGPGVVIGRKGSLGTVHYIPTDYWPHDTTLWVKDFKGNNPRYAAYLLETMRLKRFDTGAANPTLNRNIVHGEKIAIPPKDQQVEIGASLEAVESKLTIHEGRKRSFQDLFRALLHELMTAKTRVHEIEFTKPNN